jgi:hypothetical protein
VKIARARDTGREIPGGDNAASQGFTSGRGCKPGPSGPSLHMALPGWARGADPRNLLEGGKQDAKSLQVEEQHLRCG